MDEYSPHFKVGEKRVVYMDYIHSRRPYKSKAVLKNFIRFYRQLNLEAWEVCFLDEYGMEEKERAIIPIKITSHYEDTTKIETNLVELDMNQTSKKMGRPKNERPLKPIINPETIVKEAIPTVKRGRGRPKGSKNFKTLAHQNNI